ncbi:MAG: AAA family ATPase, partial [Bacteroidales bacterium]|nr:AAA family ATPase [Bacteroidales bacterium]
MNVKQLNIMGYRGIKSLKLNLDPKTTVLIGENNTGKTSILHALDLVLNHQANSTDTWSKISPYDFYQTDLSNTNQENENFSITLLLSEKSQNQWSEDMLRSLKDVLISPDIKVIDNKKEKAVTLQQIKVKYIVNYQNHLNKFTTEVLFLSLNDEIIDVDHTNYHQILCQLINFSFLSALRDSSREFGKQGQFWNKLIKTINVPETDAIDIEQKLQSLNEQLLKSNEHLGTISNNFSKISRIISLKEDKPASFEGIPTRIFDTISNIKLFLTSNQNCKLPLERYGEGTQSLSVLQLFQAFTELINDNESTSILALEEPEAHLHPSATRKLASIINNLSEQVIVSSHSGDFVSSVDLNSIRRLYKKNGETFVGQVNETTNLDDNEL